MKTYFITKYALTKGIYTVEAEVSTSVSESFISTKGAGGYHKPYWHETKQDAIANAEKMRSNKISNLKKQLAKLETMRFTDEENAPMPD